jgi:uncharacterized protein YggU (UPF0235/DUF167 family)
MEIRVKITPNIKNERVELLPDGRYHVFVYADRKGGQANSRMKELLALHFSVNVQFVAITSGHTSSTKTVHIHGAQK